MTEKNHKLAAIVFTDVVGYTRQMEQDEHRTMQLLQKQRDIVFPIVKSYNGEVIKELGDGLLLMFSSAIEAVRCAVEIQTRLKDEELTIRAGIHVGEVIFKDGDVFGSAVNAAARIQSLAQANGLCISEDVKIQVQNKTDIRMNSIGIRELKGIKDPMEIYEVFIEGVTESKKKNIKYVFSDLWSRRVFHVVGLYLVGAWLIRMVISSLVNNAMYSPHLVDLAWAILLSLIPTVFIITYYHGYRKSGNWTKAELIGFPSNIVFSIFLIVFLFKGKDLGAATTTVTIQDENGNKTEKTILKNEFRKKTLVFFFENKSGDTSLNWLQYGIPIFVEYDASQDIFMEVWGTEYFIEKLKKEGCKDGIVTNLGSIKKIAEDAHRTTFMTGTINAAEGKYAITTRLYNTSNVKLIAENQFSGEDLFKIIDDITVELKRNLEIPESHIEESLDMDVTQISTNSVEAMKYFTKGIVYALFDNKWDKGMHYLEKAVEKDPNFILAYMNLSGFYELNNQMSKLYSALKKVMDNLNRLPETHRYVARYSYFTINQQPEKALNLCEEWVKVYPHDIKAHQALGTLYGLRNKNQNKIKEYQIILDLDPEQVSYLKDIGGLYQKSGNYDSARIYFELYKEKFPKDYTIDLALGDLNLLLADFNKAKECFEDALANEPGNVNTILSLAKISFRTGNIDEVSKYCDEALTAARSAQDSSIVYYSIMNYYSLKGQMLISLEYLDKYLHESAKYLPPFMNLFNSFEGLDLYIQAKKSEEAITILQNTHKDLQPPYDKLISLGYLFFYLETKNAEEAEKYISEVEEFIKGFGFEFLRPALTDARGKIAEIRNDYKSALMSYQEYLKSKPNEYETYQWISRCYRELGEFKDAEKNIEFALKQHPFNPENNYEAAMLYMKRNDKQKAKEYLDRALEVWKDADATYEPYQKALELKKQLEAV
jgi:class 3 adenylate cyclase/tetratricopeptide (TPR) repeat protein